MPEPLTPVLVLTPTARLARDQRRRRAEAQQAAGRRAWPTEAVLTLSAWVAQLRGEALLAGAIDDVPVTSAQARSLWERAVDIEIFVGEPRVAELAERAWRTLHEYGLDPPESWPELMLNQDARAFRDWAERYRALCRHHGVIDEWAFAAKLPQLIGAGAIAVPPRVEVIGRELPPTTLEQALLDALRAAGCDVSGTEAPAADLSPGELSLAWFDEPDDELHAAASWARARLEADPAARVAVVVPDLGERLGAVERAFRSVFDPPGFALGESGPEPWHVSLGPLIGDWPLVAEALLLLRLDPQRLSQARACRLLRSPWLAGADRESRGRAEAARALMERAPHEITATEWARDCEAAGAEELAGRIRQWSAIRRDHRRATRPSEWSARFQLELEAMGFARGRTLDSREFQVLGRWHELLESLAALDVVADGSVARAPAVGTLAERARTNRFRERDPGCPVEVLGIEEALGSRFDAAWITTLDHETWPKPARRDPLIPGPVQARVPAATADGRLARARAELAGLLRTAPEVCGSFSVGSDDQPREATPLLAGAEPARGDPRPRPEPVALECIDADTRGPGFGGDRVRGGSGVLRDQSACPFRAFAAHRLAAAHPQPPRPGLGAAARGSVLHRALEVFWDGLDGLAELQTMDAGALDARIEQSADFALAEFVKPYRHRLGAGARSLEQRCTARALARWLSLERARADFRVVERERKVAMRVGALELGGKIDRIDETQAGTVLIDYKTGRATTSGWTPEPRIADPQLPAYAIALDPPPAGIAFARLAPDDLRFDGLAETDAGMPGVVALADAKRGWKAFDDWRSLLAAWRGQLEALAAQFVDGQAAVDPRDAQACRYCDLHALCRIDERQLVDRRPEDGQ